MKSLVTLNNLRPLIMTVRVSKPLQWRIRTGLLIMRVACWVMGVGLNVIVEGKGGGT